MSGDAAGRDDDSTIASDRSGASQSTAVDLEQVLLKHIEATCERFKADLGAGGRPRIEDTLGQGTEAGHPVLLRELLILELASRRQRGERPAPGEYRARFPGQEVAIRAAFEKLDPAATDRGFAVALDATQRDAEAASRTPDTLVTEAGSSSGDPPTTAPGLLASADIEILGELGRGGMGVVYRAYDRRRKQVVALKVLPLTSPSALYRFKQEFRTLADVTHTNLVSLYELISDGRQWSFTMELVEGVNLLAHLRPADEADPGAATVVVAPPDRAGPGPAPASRPHPAPPSDSLRDAFRQLAAGVEALHEAGKIHRDLKPSNVLVTKSGRVVILDLGIAAELDRAGKHQSTDQHVVGTVAYMAPEQGAGLPVSPACDWYSVGVMLFEALTGRLPFGGASFEVLLDKQKLDAPSPRSLVPEIPDDLATLCADLLRRDPEARPTGRDVLRRLGGGADRPGTVPAPRPSQGQGQVAPLIGRERHLAALDDAFQAMKRGKTVACSVHGRSGVGKSVLVQRFLDDLPARDEAVVLAGRCYEQESVPYKAFDSLVDALSRHLRRLPRWEVEALLPRDVQLLGRVFPVLRRVAAVAEAPRRGLDVPDLHELRQRAFAALRELLARLGDRKPLILAIDDLQWADVDSAALLSDLLRPPDPPSLLLLACSRSEESATNPFARALLALGEAEGSALDRRELAVEALTTAEAGALARALFGREDPAAAMQADAIARESGGNPFFVAELVSYLESGAGPEDRPGAPTAIALDQVLGARVGRLPEQARRLLEVIAVSGQPLSQSAACRAVELGSEERSALAVLRAGRLIRSASQAAREVIETYHDRIRETVVAQLAPEVREDCHHRLALALLASGETDAETLAVHFRGANHPERAGEYFARAADQAAEALAFDRAANLYRLALELRPASAPDPSADEEGRRLRTRLGDALANAGRGAEAAREYLAARRGARVAEALELERRAAMQYLISGYIDEGIAVLGTVLGAVGMTLPGTPRRALGALLLGRLLIRLRGFGFRERDVSQVTAEDLTRIDICWTGVAGFSLVDPILAAVFQTRNLRLALRAGEPYRVARALAMQAFHTAAAGGPSRERTGRLLEAARGLAERVGHPHALGMSALASAVAVYCLGRWREAHEACERADAIFRGRCSGVAWELTTVRVISLPALIWMGEHAEAFRRLQVYRQEAQERGERYSLSSLGAFGIHERLAADDPEQARSDLAAIMAAWSHRGFHVQHMEELWVQLHIDLYCEDSAAAWDRLARQWPALEHSLIMRVQVIRIGMRHLRARCALARAVAVADPAPFLAAAERDARRIEREGMGWGVALAHLIRAGVAATHGDESGAVARLNAAVAGLEAGDMRYPAAVARRRLGELIGGDEGRALLTQVNSWMTAQKIGNPDRYSAMLAPGFRR